LFVGLYGVAGFVTGEKLIAGFLGAIWGYMAVAGSYELNRRKFNWSRGEQFADQNLLLGTIAVSFGLAISGAIQESMPALAIIPVLSAIKQANDGHRTSIMAWIHSTILAIGTATGIWFYTDGVIGQSLMFRIEALP
jgi:hypothetical protein